LGGEHRIGDRGVGQGGARRLVERGERAADRLGDRSRILAGDEALGGFDRGRQTESFELVKDIGLEKVSASKGIGNKRYLHQKVSVLTFYSSGSLANPLYSHHACSDQTKPQVRQSPQSDH
jgi:hypothetical protein